MRLCSPRLQADLDRLFRAAADRARAKATVGHQRYLRHMRALIAEDETQIEQRGYTHGGVSATQRSESQGKVKAAP